MNCIPPEDDDFDFTEAIAMLASGISISIQEFYCDQEAGGRAELAQIVRMAADLIENEHSTGEKSNNNNMHIESLEPGPNNNN